MSKTAKKKLVMPSSVVHYTSLEVVHTLLNHALSEEDENIILHASFLTMMNDADEGKYVLDKYYTGSILKNKLKEKWKNEFYPKHLPFIFSTIATNLTTRGKGSLPMWKMYGNDFKGAFIRFDAKKLKTYCDNQSFIFDSCRYHTTTKVKQVIKEFNREYRRTGHPPFEEILLESCLTKRISWKHEDEWRIIIQTSKENIKTKSAKRGIVEYVEIPIPLELIEEICLGPMADEHSSDSLNILKEQLAGKYPDKIHFQINKSKISIQ